MCCKVTQIIQNFTIPCSDSVYTTNGNERIRLTRQTCDYHWKWWVKSKKSLNYLTKHQQCCNFATSKLLFYHFIKLIP